MSSDTAGEVSEVSTEKFLMKIREGTLELSDGLVLGYSHGNGSPWFNQMLFLKASSQAQLSYHCGGMFSSQRT